MNATRILGIVLLVGGVALLIVGLNSSDSIADRVSNTFTGRFTDATNWYIIGGIIMGVAGVVIAGAGMFRKGR
jgi:uncharacterized membrane protein YdcZ (DUF606 family)